MPGSATDRETVPAPTGTVSGFGTLPNIFKPVSDVLDVLGRNYTKFRNIKLQEDILKAQINQARLLGAVETPQNVGAVPGRLAVSTQGAGLNPLLWAALAVGGVALLVGIARP